MLNPRKRSSRLLQSRNRVQAGRRQLMRATGERLPVDTLRSAPRLEHLYRRNWSAHCVAHFGAFFT
jgi:hypothetical protein